MSDRKTTSVHERWAHLRHSVVGGLLASPPGPGELQGRIDELAAKDWLHPVTGKRKRFGASTIQRWYYMALGEPHDPVTVLRRKVRRDLGTQGSMNSALEQALVEQYEKYPDFTMSVHYTNLDAFVEKHPEAGPMPSYSTVRRFLKAKGLNRRPCLSSRHTEGVERAKERLAKREVRSWEVEYVNACWHWDGHKSSLQVLTDAGKYETPILIGVLDDRSRLACHLQWYLGAERARIAAHTWSQAIMKRGLPRSSYTDNGSAMIAAEIQQGLDRLGVIDAHTLPASPYMNAKIEVLWARIEGQLIPQLRLVKELTLAHLNEVTQAWCEYDYNRGLHSEIKQTPLERFLAGPDVQRPSPDPETLRIAFMRADWRVQRMSDGSIVVKGSRFEIPNRYRHMQRVLVRYADWDLKYMWLVDDRTGEVLCRLFPQDKAANAAGVRRPLEPVARRRGGSLLEVEGVPPALARSLTRQAATGLPPYLPMDAGSDDSSDGDSDSDSDESEKGKGDAS